MAFEGLFWLDIPNTGTSLLQGLPENFAFWQCQQPLVSLRLCLLISAETLRLVIVDLALSQDSFQMKSMLTVNTLLTSGWPIECWANRCELHGRQDISMKKLCELDEERSSSWGQDILKRRGSSSAMTITGQCLTWSFCASLFMWIQFI